MGNRRVSPKMIVPHMCLPRLVSPFERRLASLSSLVSRDSDVAHGIEHGMTEAARHPAFEDEEDSVLTCQYTMLEEEIRERERNENPSRLKKRCYDELMIRIFKESSHRHSAKETSDKETPTNPIRFHSFRPTL